jgi:UPF0271 protein
MANGSLTPRSEPGAILKSVEARAQQALAIATGAPIRGSDSELKIKADTLCIHSDSPGAVETAMAVRSALSDAGVKIRPFA